MPNLNKPFESVFRTESWVQAWIDTWGNDRRIRLIDLGGRGNPLEYIYQERGLIKKSVPTKCLNLAGVGGFQISSPRSEYNDLNALLGLFGGARELFRELAKLNWQQFYLRDCLANVISQWCSSSNYHNAHCVQERHELAYHVDANSFPDYLMSLGTSTRLKYFNRRNRLANFGEIERIGRPSAEAGNFFKELNNFHLMRWGRPCYSEQSQQFMSDFFCRLESQGGKVILDGLYVDGELVSVLLDVVWQGRRYNLQSGYLQQKYSRISLGSIHLGYGIEEAIKNSQIYDFMAGTGKNENYKLSISNASVNLQNLILVRGWLKIIYKIFGK